MLLSLLLLTQIQHFGKLVLNSWYFDTISCITFRPNRHIVFPHKELHSQWLLLMTGCTSLASPRQTLAPQSNTTNLVSSSRFSHLFPPPFARSPFNLPNVPLWHRQQLRRPRHKTQPQWLCLLWKPRLTAVSTRTRRPATVREQIAHHLSPQISNQQQVIAFNYWSASRNYSTYIMDTWKQTYKLYPAFLWQPESKQLPERRWRQSAQRERCWQTHKSTTRNALKRRIKQSRGKVA